jgi:hypothetical protein
MRYFDVPRLMHDDTVYAEEVQGIREFGTESVLMQIRDRSRAPPLSGPTGLLASVEYTKEYLRLAAVQGLVLDPKDGSVLYNWFDEFQITRLSKWRSIWPPAPPIPAPDLQRRSSARWRARHKAHSRSDHARSTRCAVTRSTTSSRITRT